MASQGKHSIIHRKAEGGRLDFDARVMSPAKALRLALAKSADKLLELVLTVTMVEQVVLAHGKLKAEVGNDGLLIVLDAACGACGAVKFDTQFLAGLIEVQTTGFVHAAEAKPRPVTITDAAMVAPMVNAVLQGYDAVLKESLPGHQTRGFRFGDMIEGGRALSLLLDAPEYDLFRLSVDLAEGAKTGMLTLILPVQPKTAKAPQEPGSQAEGHGGFNGGFKGNALDAPVTMDVVVARIRMPLNEVCQLAKGSIVPVPSECLSKTELVAAGNHVVSEVLLGQMNGLKAVRFAPVETAQMPDIPEPEERFGRTGDKSHPTGETLEGHAVELGKTEPGNHQTERDEAIADAPTPADAAGLQALADIGQPASGQLASGQLASGQPASGQPATDLSELDALPEEV